MFCFRRSPIAFTNFSSLSWRSKKTTNQTRAKPKKPTIFSSIGSFGMNKDTCFLRGPEVNMIFVFIVHFFRDSSVAHGPMIHCTLSPLLSEANSVHSWSGGVERCLNKIFVQGRGDVFGTKSYIKIQRYFCLTSRPSSDLVFRC